MRSLLAPRPSLRPRRLPLALGPGLAAAFALVAGSPARAQPVTLSAHDFQLYKDYQAALQDPRVVKMPARRRLPAIARNFHVPLKELKAAIQAGDREGPGIGRRCEAQIRALLEAGPLKGRVRDVKVDDSQGHVVTYVSWANVDGTQLEAEASTAALAAVKGAPITWTVAVWAVDQRTGRKVFEAKIAADSAALFQPEAIPMFATARYIRLFEDVKNAYRGTPPTDDAGRGPN